MAMKKQMLSYYLKTIQNILMTLLAGSQESDLWATLFFSSPEPKAHR